MNWKLYKYYSSLPDDLRKVVHTERQWAFRGYVIEENATGAVLYEEKRSNNKNQYFHEYEVRKGTAAELDRVIYEDRIKAKETQSMNRIRAFRHMQKYQNLKRIQSRPYKKERYRTLVISIATTGLREYTDEILQLAILNADTGEMLFDEYFKPMSLINDKRFKNVDFSDMQPIQFYARKIQGLIYSATKIIGFDVLSIKDFLDSYGIHIPDLPITDLSTHDYVNLWGMSLWDMAERLDYDCREKIPGKADDDCEAVLYCYKHLYLGNKETII